MGRPNGYRSVRGALLEFFIRECLSLLYHTIVLRATFSVAVGEIYTYV